MTHLEGKDVILLSPGQTATVKSGETMLTGQVAFARVYTDRTLRLAVVKGTGATAQQEP